MGYERKLYVVCEYDNSEYADIIATIDIGKDYNLDKAFTRHATKKIYILESDDDLEITEDKYGERLWASTPEKMLAVLAKSYYINNSQYELEKVAIDMITSIVQNVKSLPNERVMIYSYGY